MSSDALQLCISQLFKNRNKTQKELSQIISAHFPIIKVESSPLPQLAFYREDLIEDRYIPSPELLTTYNSHLQQTLDLQIKPQNFKLRQMYPLNGSSSLGMEAWGKQSKGLGRGTSAIIVGQRQQNILKGVAEGKIEATIPQMESSLKMYEIQSLGRKDVKMENIEQQAYLEKGGDKLADWRKAREKMMKNLGKK